MIVRPSSSLSILFMGGYSIRQVMRNNLVKILRNEEGTCHIYKQILTGPPILGQV